MNRRNNTSGQYVWIVFFFFCNPGESVLGLEDNFPMLNVIVMMLPFSTFPRVFEFVSLAIMLASIFAR